MLQNPSDFSKILQSTAQQICSDLASAMSMDEEFAVIVDSTLYEPFIIAIDAGYPPTLHIDAGYMSKVMYIADDKERKQFIKSLRRKLSLAISKVPRQFRTLSQNPIAETIAMESDKKSLAKTNHPDKIHFSLPESSISIEETYTITVREISTGCSVTKSGTNPSLLRNQALAQLNSIVWNLENYSIPEPTPTPEPSRILISNESSDDTIKYEYET